ncbi:MAG: wax ester/triacylglycerol synthase family O-acyltransferase [Acidimicrobiales bacterium]
MNAVDRFAHLQRMTSLDAAFLDLETPTTPMHIGSVAYLDPGPLRDRSGRVRLNELRRLVNDRLSLAPRFRQRPVSAPFGLGRPVWVDDPEFDVANHVFETVLPAPGSEQQLADLCTHLMMRTLDRSRPLWELWVVDGYADGSIVLIEKVHHVMMDGVSGVDVALLVTDPTPRVQSLASAAATGAAAGAVGGASAASAPDRSLLLAGGALDELGLPLAMVGAPLRMAGLLGRALRHPEVAADLAQEVGALGRGVLSLLQRTTVAPHTPLNEPVGSHRVLSHVEWPLEEMRAVAKTAGCTVNDVALAAVTSGVRSLLLSRGEDPGWRFQVAVPVSTRGATGHLTLGNQVAAFLVSLPTGLPEVSDQLEEVHRITKARKRQGQAGVVAAVLGSSNRWPTALVGLVAHLTHHQRFANAVVTNIPGPPAGRYVLGARMRRIVPLVPLAGNLDVSIGILSYDGEVSFGCLADAERCPDLEVFTDGILQALKTLAPPRTSKTAAAS